MMNEVRELAGKWLREGEVDAVFALKRKEGHLGAHLFLSGDDLRELDAARTHRVLYTCRIPRKNILSVLQSKSPKLKIGVVVRGCEERALIELAKREQVDLERLKVLGVACSAEDARACRCSRPYPAELAVGERVEVEVEPLDKAGLQAMGLDQRLELWSHAFQRCIKCYGCRNACPVCACADCKMEQELYVPTGSLPPAAPLFHFIRFYHIAEKCIACGECERACPVGMPLLSLAGLLKNDMRALFNYEAGLNAEQASPLLLTLDLAPLADDGATESI